MPEKRKSQRTACLAECLVLRYPGGSASCSSRILNYSQRGLKIETECPLRNNEQIKICGLDIAFDSIIAGLGQRVGQVRWCSSGPPRSAGRYEAGVTVIGGVSENSGRRGSPK